ncbi:ApeA N-terminal domain 1-containing protein [Cyclobacterium xiamenense]|uniref:ApeA N-terminal domain 1-containing protein n=1 Tax=Cyclobacterium xiamenense TaxID=1297121 RepID=UPI0012B6C293|nr:HEPN domain-containing protein [Cyclobacterium xiamenense]
MKKKKVFKGFWWLPERPKKLIPGTVNFDPQGKIVLELIGNLHEDENLLIFHSKRRAELIYGIDSSHVKISLLYCSVTNHDKSYRSNFSLTTYRIQFILYGIHLLNINEKIFYKLNFNTDKLNKWFLRSNYKNSYTFNSNNQISKFSISYDSSVDKFLFNVQIDNNFSIEILSNSWQNENEFDDISIHQIYLIKISTIKAITFFEFLEKAERLNLFFELAFASKVSFINLSIFNFQNNQEELKNESITVYYNRVSFLRENAQYDRPIFNFQMIEKKFDKILCNWMEIDSKLLPILNYLVKSFQNDYFFDPSNFMIVVNALEGFHRRFRDKKENKDKVEIPLKDRLNSLVNEFNSIRNFKRLKFNTFLISRNRHYYSHFYEKDFKYLYEMQDLINITFDLRKLLYCCVLREIGFDDELLNMINLELL